MTSIEIRVLGPTGFGDHHAHLLRLDPAVRILSLADATDDRGVDGHCLRLMATDVIVIGGFIDGTLRACLEIIPGREIRDAEAAFTSESAFRSSALSQMLIARLFDEVRGRRLTTVRLRGVDDIAWLATTAHANGVEVEPGSPLGLHFGSMPATVQQALPAYA